MENSDVFSPVNLIFLPPPSPSPFLRVIFPYLETHFIWNLQGPHLLGSQKNFLPGNTQQQHSPKYQSEQQKNKESPTEQRQDQISSPIISIFPIPAAMQHPKNTINNIQDRISPLEPSHPTTAGS